MTLLNIWHSGGVTEMLLGFAALISGIFWYRAWKGSKQEARQQDSTQPDGYRYLGYRIPFYQQPSFKLGVAVWVLIILALIFIVGPDYKGL